MQYFVKTYRFKQIDCGRNKKRSKGYLEPVFPNDIYQVLNYLKTHNNFYEHVSISEGLSRKEMINFSGIDKLQDVAGSIHKNIISKFS